MRPMHSRSRPVVDRQIGLIESEPGGVVLNGFCERELGHGRHALVVGPSLLQTGHKIMGPLEFTYYYLCCPRNSQVDTCKGWERVQNISVFADTKPDECRYKFEFVSVATGTGTTLNLTDIFKRV